MPKNPKPVKHSFLCKCGARFDSRDEYLKHIAASPDHLTEKQIEKGEPGQTEEERREWQDVQREEQA